VATAPLFLARYSAMSSTGVLAQHPTSLRLKREVSLFLRTPKSLVLLDLGGISGSTGDLL